MHPFFLSLAPPATLADPGEAWELWQLEVSGGGNWEKQLVEVAEELEEEVEGVKLGGLFTSVFGPIQVVILTPAPGAPAPAPPSRFLPHQ